MKYCRNCNKAFPNTITFCPECGASFGFKYCLKNQHPNPLDATFCVQCGSRNLSTPHDPPYRSGPRISMLAILAIFVPILALLTALVPFYMRRILPSGRVFFLMIIVAIIMAISTKYKSSNS